MILKSVFCCWFYFPAKDTAKEWQKGENINKEAKKKICTQGSHLMSLICIDNKKNGFCEWIKIIHDVGSKFLILTC